MINSSYSEIPGINYCFHSKSHCFPLAYSISQRQPAVEYNYVASPIRSSEQDLIQHSATPAQPPASARSSHYEHLKVEYEHHRSDEPYVKIRQSAVDSERDEDGYEEVENSDISTATQ